MGIVLNMKKIREYSIEVSGICKIAKSMINKKRERERYNKYFYKEYKSNWRVSIYVNITVSR